MADESIREYIFEGKTAAQADEEAIIAYSAETGNYGIVLDRYRVGPMSYVVVVRKNEIRSPGWREVHNSRPRNGGRVRVRMVDPPGEDAVSPRQPRRRRRQQEEGEPDWQAILDESQIDVAMPSTDVSEEVFCSECQVVHNVIGAGILSPTAPSP